MFSQARSWHLRSKAEPWTSLVLVPGEKKILHQMLKMGENENKRELSEQMTTHMDAKANDDIQLHCQYLVRQTVPFIHWLWVSNESKQSILTITPSSDLFVI